MSARTLNDQLFHEVLEATGYLIGGQPAPGVTLGDEATANRRFRSFKPNGKWRGESALTVYFKLEPEPPSEERIARWRREIWNEGQSPLLWVISQNKIDLYNGFARPLDAGDARTSRLRTFEKLAGELEELDRLAGRFAMETGRFWEHNVAKSIHRGTSVNQELLSDLASLERDLLQSGMARLDAQGLIGRSIFAQYLVDRGIATPEFLNELCGENALSDVLRDERNADSLFDWLRKAFNGDMFPNNGHPDRPEHLRRVANFLDAEDPRTGQRTLFPYQFNIIPVGFISSIYEQFVQADPTIRGSTGGTDVHYTTLGCRFLLMTGATLGLANRAAGSDSSLCRLYVDQGIDRFASGKYASNHATGFMVGYVILGTPAAAAGGVNDQLKRRGRPAEQLELSSPCEPWVRKSCHRRPSGGPIRLLHAFLDWSLGGEAARRSGYGAQRSAARPVADKRERTGLTPRPRLPQRP